MCREYTIDNRIRRRIQRCQTLYEGCDCRICLGGWYVPENLQKVEDYVGAPADYKYWNIMVIL